MSSFKNPIDFPFFSFGRAFTATSAELLLRPIRGLRFVLSLSKETLKTRINRFLEVFEGARLGLYFNVLREKLMVTVPCEFWGILFSDKNTIIPVPVIMEHMKGDTAQVRKDMA